MRFDVLEPPRSSVEAPYTSLSWGGSCRFDVLGADTLVRGGTSTANLIEPTRTTPSQ